MSHDRILVVTDDKDPAREAIAEAITLAKAFDATLDALYVLEAVEPPPWVDDPAAEPGVDTKAGQALNQVGSEAADRDLEGEVVTAIVKGQPAPAILGYAREHNIDLIVMGIHGREGLDRLIGSTAEHVVREAPVPVVTVKAE